MLLLVYGVGLVSAVVVCNEENRVDVHDVQIQISENASREDCGTRQLVFHGHCPADVLRFYCSPAVVIVT